MARPSLAPPLVLFASLSLLASCTSSERVGRSERTLTNERLHSVVLLSGEEVVFGGDGGRYTRIRTIVGTSAAGAPVTIPEDNLLQARSWRSPGVPLDSVGSWRFAEILLKDSTLVSFDASGGRFDAAKNVITGRSAQYADPVNFHPRVVLEYRELAGTSVNNQVLAGDTTVRIAELLLRQPRYHAVEFDQAGGRIGAPTEWIVGKDATGTPVKIPLASILYCSVERFDAARTIVGVIGGTVVFAAVVIVIAIATKQSCPFIYTYDGARYHFDAEPLGGATTEGLARTDYSRLKFLQPADGKYTLLLRNEVDETQFVDELGLCFIDHDPSRTVVPAGGNSFHLLPTPSPPVSATDGEGRDLIPFVARKDGICWQTPTDRLPATIDSIRETLTFKFLKPRSARRAQLVVHGGTTQWGSNTIRLMYNLLGTDVDRWYTEADRQGPELYRLLRYLEREELYTLRVYVRKNGAWAERGSVTGGGPFIYETQTLPLSVSGIDGDTLCVQVRPPLGFWSFDFAGVVFDDDSLCTGTTAPLLSATDQDGRDISGLIGARDRRYFEMPTNSEEAVLTFAAPRERPGLARTLFAKTSGYYRLHLAKDHPPQRAIMDRLDSTPGEIVRYALEKYREWLGGLHAQMSEKGAKP